MTDVTYINSMFIDIINNLSLFICVTRPVPKGLVTLVII